MLPRSAKCDCGRINLVAGCLMSLKHRRLLIAWAPPYPPEAGLEAGDVG